MPIKHLYFQSNSAPVQQITYWGSIQGELNMQADLQTQFNSKSDLNHEHNNLYEPKNSNIQNHIGDSLIHLPGISGQAGKYLKNDGISNIWADLPAFLNCINVNTTLTVKSGTVDNIATFNTLSDALQSIANKWIMPSVLVNIEIENGIFTSTSTIVINHPCSERIRIYGKNTYSANFTNLYSYSGTSGSYSVVFVVNDVTNIEVGNYIMIKTPSTNLLLIKGVWKITAVDTINKRVTCFITTSRGNPATGIMTGSFTIIKSVLKFSATTGIEVRSPLIDIANLVIEGAIITGQNIYGLYLNKGLMNCAGNFGISNFETGLRVFAANAFVDGIMISGCRSGSLGYGIYLINGANVVAKSAYFTGNYYNIFATEMSRLDCRSSFILGGYYGVYSERLSITDCNAITKDNTADLTPASDTYGNIQAYNNTL
jgi:hypothetical protein